MEVVGDLVVGRRGPRQPVEGDPGGAAACGWPRRGAVQDVVQALVTGEPASSSGYAASRVKNAPGTRSPGTSTSRASGCPAIDSSQAGMSRSAPSRNPMYQSGAAPALMLPG